MDILQRARDIAADTYVRMEEARLAADGPPQISDYDGNPYTEDSWREFTAGYTQHMRNGAYDSVLAVQVALAALNQVPA